MSIRWLLLPLFLAVLVPLGAAQVPNKKDWPVFRGNAPQTGIADSALPAKLTQLWTFETKDSIEAAPAVVKGVAYVGSMDGHLYAIDLATGKEKWKYKTAPKDAAPIKAAPAVRDGLVFVGDSDGTFHCVDAETGKKRWTYSTDAEIVSGANFADDLVLFGSFDETLYCLDRAGKLKWKVKTEGPVNGSPAVADGKTFAAGCDSAVHVIDIKEGKELKKIELGGQAAASAAVLGDHLYVGTMTNVVEAVDWKKGAVLWTFTPEERPQAFYSSAAVSGNLIVVGNRNKRVYAIDRTKGQAVWSFATRNRVDGSPVIVGQRVLIGSLDGKLYVLDLAGGTPLETITLDSGIAGSPAVAEGRLLVGTTKGTLYCFGEKK